MLNIRPCTVFMSNVVNVILNSLKKINKKKVYFILVFTLSFAKFNRTVNFMNIIICELKISNAIK